MALSALAKPFLSLPLFDGLTPLQLSEIVRRADRIVFRPGDTLIAEDQIGEAAFLIVSGEAVRINADGAGDLNEPIAEGAMIGELAMLVETTHTTTVLARTTVKALRLSREDMHDALIADPSIAHHFSAKLTERLNDFAAEIAIIDRELAAIGTDIDPSALDTFHTTAVAPASATLRSVPPLH